jgi:hypothetical protein
VAAPPVEPVPGAAGWGRVSEQPTGSGMASGISPELGGRGLIWQDRRGCGGPGATAEQRGGDDADGQGSHDQHGVPTDRGVGADLELVEPEAVLTELENLLRLTSKSPNTAQRRRELLSNRSPRAGPKDTR